MAGVKNKIIDMKNKLLLRNSCRDLIWLIDILPKIGGFSVDSEKIVATFWIIHIILTVYVYGYNTTIYQLYYANEFIDNVHSFLNISILLLIINASVWTISKRSQLKSVLKLVKINDDLVTGTSLYVDKQTVFLRRIKFVLIIYYSFHFINDVCNFIPTRVVNLADGTIGTCFGLEPMDAVPNRGVCGLIVALQELTSIVAVVNYDVSVIFLLGHTTAMYNILYKDVLSLNDIKNKNLPSKEISRRLRHYIIRHSFLLQTVNKLQKVYSSAIGAGFGVNAMSMSLFLLLPLKVWLEFAPIVYYSVSVFFLYCYQGQRLTTATEKLERAVYCCGWENFSLEDKKLVLFMLKQAQKPVILLAAHVIPIRIYTFASTMRSIYRFFAVFKL